MADLPSCIIVSNTVTGICTVTVDAKKCMDVEGRICLFRLSHTINIIMANWSRMMWQNVMDRAVRMLTSGPFGSHFFTVRATVGGN
ncbi:hypothetical protein KIN20_030995 [Parelaphostrongylus tenuis]|uniref:Uncharacterized protein n=1 Tax=Parelaphostrongylus tenuis TaxID=148309 RepID=A0AAD5WGQ2_PARTN|nr:hypothetical protein KIN20_030995 [Parelaphostrongylus tenuis]